MTPQQTRAIERIKAMIVAKHAHGGAGAHEFKRFEIDDNGGALVFLTTEYGPKCDEGSLAALVCRDRRLFAIGRRGGVRLLMLDGNLRSTSPANVRGLVDSVTYWHSPKRERRPAITEERTP
jgi:hypothetical protein